MENKQPINLLQDGSQELLGVSASVVEAVPSELVEHSFWTTVWTGDAWWWFRLWKQRKQDR